MPRCRRTIRNQKSRKTSKRVLPIQSSSALGISMRYSGRRCGESTNSPPHLCSVPRFRYTVAHAVNARFFMSGKKQVWFIEGSAAAALAAPLRAHYDLHPVPQNKEKDAHALISLGSNGISSVWLADINALGEISHPQATALPNKNRVIAIFSGHG